MSGIKITGWGFSVPEKILTNKDFESMLDTSDNWIVERTGIKERHVGGTNATLAYEASIEALKRRGVEADSVGTLVIATTTPDQTVPATSSHVHELLNMHGAAFDINAACAGFVYALVVGSQMVNATKKPALIVGSDVLSKITDYTDRTTAVLFGDAAGALYIEPSESDNLLAFDLGVDGTAKEILYCDHGSYLRMNGKEVFRRAVRVTVESAQKVLEEANLTPEDIALFVPHQANLRIIDAVGERLFIPKEKRAVVVDWTGNTSAASIPVALAHSANHEKIKPGDLVLLAGFGAGMTWSSAIVRWGES